MDHGELRDVFEAFCSFGKGSFLGRNELMDNVAFAKLARECGLLDSSLTKTDIDLIFVQVKPKGERRINFDTFAYHALPLMAKKKFPGHGIPSGQASLISVILQSRGPRTTNATSTATDRGIYAKLTDATHYTGFHKSKVYGPRGGAADDGAPHEDGAHSPRGTEGESKLGSAGSFRRSHPRSDGGGAAEWKEGGREDSNAAALAAAFEAQASFGGTSSTPVRAPGVAYGRMPSSSGRAGDSVGSGGDGDSPGPESLSGRTRTRRGSRITKDFRPYYNESDLFSAFLQFATFGASKLQADALIDSARFFKMAKETQLISRSFDKTDCDLIFTKLDYDHFKFALSMIASKKFPQLSAEDATRQVFGQVCALGQPSVHATRVRSDELLSRLTDPTQFTGHHRHRFDSKGRGRGLAGRDSVAKGSGATPTRYRGGAVHDLSQIVVRR